MSLELTIYRPFATLSQDAENAKFSIYSIFPEKGENTMRSALRAKNNGFYYCRYHLSEFPSLRGLRPQGRRVRNSDKTNPLRPLRLCGETVFGQE
jgi:hypothetical protein